MGLADTGRMGLSILVCATFWAGIFRPEKCMHSSDKIKSRREKKQQDRKRL
jgi:hypothetical protein